MLFCLSTTSAYVHIDIQNEQLILDICAPVQILDFFFFFGPDVQSLNIFFSSLTHS